MHINIDMDRNKIRLFIMEIIEKLSQESIIFTYCFFIRRFHDIDQK